MLRPFTKIQIQQVPTPLWGNRNLSFILDFTTDYSIESTWEKHTDNCTIKFPKNISLYANADGIFQASGTYNAILGGSGVPQSENTTILNIPVTVAPLIMKGDIITINHGYIGRNLEDQDFYISTGDISPISTNANSTIQSNNLLSTQNNLFQGYVSEVNSGTPIEIKCEDNFYLLKKTPFPKSVWNKTEAPSGNTSLYGLMSYIISLVNTAFYENKDFSVATGLNTIPSKYPELSLLDVPNSITAEFSLGYLEIGDMTCAQLLDKLKQQYHLESTFRGNVLQFGFPIYLDASNANLSPIPANLLANSNNFFNFRDIYNENNSLICSANIFPSHDLNYVNKDDVVLSATVQCKVINQVAGKSTLSGQQKTKVEKLKVYVYWDSITSTFKSINLSQGQVSNTQTPANKDGGERHEFYYPVDKSNPNPTTQNLIDLGVEQLKKYHYTGFKGCFTTFGFPYVQWNDNINLLDPIYSDRNGQYKVKKVIYKGGLHGLSQEIHLDYKIDVKPNSNPQSIYIL